MKDYLQIFAKQPKTASEVLKKAYVARPQKGAKGQADDLQLSENAQATNPQNPAKDLLHPFEGDSGTRFLKVEVADADMRSHPCNLAVMWALSRGSLSQEPKLRLQIEDTCACPPNDDPDGEWGLQG